MSEHCRKIYAVNELPHVIPIGVQSEKGVEEIRFDVKPWLDAWDGLELAVYPTRPGEDSAYPAADVELIGTVLYWYPNDADTAIAGEGKVEIVGVTADKRKLSGSCKTFIRATSIVTTMEPPKPVWPGGTGNSGFPNGQFSAAQIERVAGNVTNIEYWFFVNARWDAETKRFKRIDLNKNSFGIQMQAAGTYPGEETLGYTDNQAIGYWRATGRDTFLNGGDTASAEAVTEDIGVEVDGEWREFGVMLGWINSYMIDSYGGLTVGGAGFEIDGNGLYPYVRTSLSKFDDPAGEKGFAFDGLLWNAYHKLMDSDDKTQDSWGFGLQAPIDYYRDGEKNIYSNYTRQDKTRLVFLHRLANTGHALKDWHEAFALTADGDITFAGKIRRVLCDGSDHYVQCAYPDGFNADNTEFLRLEKDDGATVLTPSAVTLTDFGIAVSTEESIAETDAVYAVIRDKYTTGTLTERINAIIDTKLNEIAQLKADLGL